MKNLLSVIAISILCIACNTVQKTVSKTKEKVDSVSIAIVDSAVISKTDSAGSKIETGSYEKETVYHYDTVYQVIYTSGVYDTAIKYVPRVIKVYEKGIFKKEETAKRYDYDSAHKIAINSTALSKEREVIYKTKNTNRASLFFLVVVLSAGAYVLVRAYKKGQLRNIVKQL